MGVMMSGLEQATTPKKPEVVLIGMTGEDLVCTYKDAVIILTDKERLENNFKDVEDIKKFAQHKYFRTVQESKTKTAYHVPKVKKSVGGNPTTLKARKKLLAQKLKGNHDKLVTDIDSRLPRKRPTLS
jgi:hypothetical protein